MLPNHTRPADHCRAIRHPRNGHWNEWERAAVKQKLGAAIVGGPETVKRKLEDLIARTETDEVMIVSDFHRHEDRRRSYEIVASLKHVGVSRAA